MAYIDPYVTNTQSGAGLNAALNDLPPTGKGATSGAASVLQLYVPAEHTTLDLGAGTTPGIRMITDTHVHLTALQPLSTFSLGAVGGKLPSGGTPGVNIFTEENKKETILGETHESYAGDSHLSYGTTKDEIVGDVWTETGHNAKIETIAGTVTQDFNSEHNLTVGKPADYKYNSHKTEAIGAGGGGNYILSVNGTKAETIQKDLKFTVAGDTILTHSGKVTNLGSGPRVDVHDDSHTSVTTGCKLDAFRGLQCSVNMGVQMAMNLSLAVSINETASFTQNIASFTVAPYSYSRTLVENSNHLVSTVGALIAIFK